MGLNVSSKNDTGPIPQAVATAEAYQQAKCSTPTTTPVTTCSLSTTEATTSSDYIPCRTGAPSAS
jgi:hypothetical protein